MHPQHASVAFLIAVLGVAAAGTAQADTFRSHTDRWEFTVQMRYLDAQTLGSTDGSELDVNSDIGFGFGFAYNFDNHWSLGFDFGWNSPSYNATIASTDTPGTFDQKSGELSTSSMHLNLLYNFIAGPVTPFIGAGIGTTYVDSNVASGPPSTGCWVDYWGYTWCDTYQPTYSDSRFSYNASIGIRWDVARDAFLRASIGTHWIDTKNNGAQDFTTGRFEIGFMY